MLDAIIILLSGILVGGILVRWSVVAAHRRRGHQPHDEHYVAAVQAAVRYLRRHGTINRRHLEHLMEVGTLTAIHYLEHMERDGIIKAHTHRSKGGFYTLA